MEQIILASASPRRRDLLELVGIPFQVMVSNAPEIITQSEPEEIVKELSGQKARAVAGALGEQAKTRIILAADTIVYLDGKVLGKPGNEAEAFHMLQGLQGRAHTVYTGVTLLRAGISVSFCERTIVHVHAMTPEEIEGYIATGDPLDKAGAYGIQGPFAAYIDDIEGNYTNVMGLPVSRVYRELKALRSAD